MNFQIKHQVCRLPLRSRADFATETNLLANEASKESAFPLNLTAMNDEDFGQQAEETLFFDSLFKKAREIEDEESAAAADPLSILVSAKLFAFFLTNIRLQRECLELVD